MTRQADLMKLWAQLQASIRGSEIDDTQTLLDLAVLLLMQAAMRTKRDTFELAVEVAGLCERIKENVAKELG